MNFFFDMREASAGCGATERRRRPGDGTSGTSGAVCFRLHGVVDHGARTGGEDKPVGMVVGMVVLWDSCGEHEVGMGMVGWECDGGGGIAAGTNDLLFNAWAEYPLSLLKQHQGGGSSASNGGNGGDALEHPFWCFLAWFASHL